MELIIGAWILCNFIVKLFDITAIGIIASL